jgi:hypothetical protein
MKTKYVIERINNINIYTSKILKELREIKDYIVLDRDNDPDRLGIFLNSENGEIYLSLDGYKQMSLESAMYYMETFGYFNEVILR